MQMTTGEKRITKQVGRWKSIQSDDTATTLFMAVSDNARDKVRKLLIHVEKGRLIV